MRRMDVLGESMMIFNIGSYNRLGPKYRSDRGTCWHNHAWFHGAGLPFRTITERFPSNTFSVCVCVSLVWNSGSAIGGDVYCFVPVSTDRDGDLPLTAATILLLWSAPRMQEPVDSWPTVAFTASQLLPHLTNIDCYTKQQRDV